MRSIFVILLVLYQNCEIKSFDEREMSKFNHFELEHFKYDLDINTRLKSAAATSELNSNLISIRSVNGQMYHCQLPDYGNSKLTNVDEFGGSSEEAANVGASSSYEDEDDEPEDDDYNFYGSTFFETTSAMSNQKLKGSKSQFNFTLVNEKIKLAMSNLNMSDICLYKVCVLKHHKQHVLFKTLTYV